MVLMGMGVAGMLMGLANMAGLAAQAAKGAAGSVRTLWCLLALGMCVFGFAFLNPSLNGLISKRSDPHRQGEVLGINQSFSALARILGPTVGMVLFTLGMSHILPYAVAAGMM